MSRATLAFVARGAVVLGVAAQIGCGGGAALMHPAHVLRPDRVTLGAGMSSTFVGGEARRAMDAARVAAAADGSLPDEQGLIEGSVAYVLTAPTIAPWVGARAGVGYDSDAGVTYTGRGARADLRHAFESGKVALSVGVGASGVLQRLHQDDLGGIIEPRPSDPYVGVDARAMSGFGFDVPVIVGWHSTGDVGMAWAGARGGYEHLAGEFLFDPQGFNPFTSNPEPAESARVNAARWWGGGLVGLAVGVTPFWVGVEIDVAWNALRGNVDRADGERRVSLGGPSLSPTGALVGKF